MDFGMFTDFHIRKGKTQSEAFEESFNQVDAAESLGMDSVWLAEHHFRPQHSVLASPLVTASSIATRTKRIRIGLGVQVLPLTNPLRVAEEAATVDHISQGRLDFGVGRSGLTTYYKGYNVPYSESRARFFEALDVITKAWCQDTFSYQGQYFTYGDVTLVPKPYQKPHPPITVAIASSETFSLMGELGYPIFIGANTAPDVLQERMKLYREGRERGGHNGSGYVSLRIPAYVAETEQKARCEPEDVTMQFVRMQANELALSAASEESAERMRRQATVSYDELLEYRLMYGAPERVVERLKEYQETLGITGVVLEMNYGWNLPYDRVLNSIRLLTEKVMPHFK